MSDYKTLYMKYKAKYLKLKESLEGGRGARNYKRRYIPKGEEETDEEKEKYLAEIRRTKARDTFLVKIEIIDKHLSRDGIESEEEKRKRKKAEQIEIDRLRMVELTDGHELNTSEKKELVKLKEKEAMK